MKHAAVGYDLLETFLVAARAGNFGRAAATLRKSVSAVSQQVRTLEARLGLPLFERHGRRVVLADPGRLLLEQAAPLFAQIDQALEVAREQRDVVRGRVRIGAPRTFAAHWLRPRLPALLAAHPDLQLDLAFGVPSELERQLADGALDIALLVRSATLELVATVPLATETFVAVAAPTYLADHGVPATAAEFATHRYLVFDDDLAMHAPFFRAAFGARAALPRTIVGRVAALEELLALAVAAVAIVILPDYLVAPDVVAGRLRILAPTRGDRPARAVTNTIHLATRRGAIPTARLGAVLDALTRPTELPRPDARASKPRRGQAARSVRSVRAQGV